MPPRSPGVALDQRTGEDLKVSFDAGFVAGPATPAPNGPPGDASGAADGTEVLVQDRGLARLSKIGRQIGGVDLDPRFIAGDAHEVGPLSAVGPDGTAVEEVGGDVGSFVAENFFEEGFVATVVGGVRFGVVEQGWVEADEAGPGPTAAEGSSEARIGFDDEFLGKVGQVPDVRPVG